MIDHGRELASGADESYDTGRGIAADCRCSQQNGIDSSFRQRFRLTRFGAANSRRARLYLKARQARALVRFCVRPKRNRLTFQSVGKTRDVAFQDVEIDNRRRRRQPITRPRLAEIGKRVANVWASCDLWRQHKIYRLMSRWVSFTW